MSDRVRLPSSQLLLFRFGPEARFEGQMVGALQRIETGGAMRVLDALFVSSDAETGELSAVGLQGDGAGGMIAPLLDFRLDERKRRAATEQAVTAGTTTIPAGTVRGLGDALTRGSAIAAVLVEHVWAEALDEAVSRIGGTPVVSEFVDAAGLGELSSQLMAAAQAVEPS